MKKIQTSFLKPGIIALYTKKFSKILDGGEISLSFSDLKQQVPSFDIGGDRIGWAASIIKIPVMIEVFNQVSKGKLSLDDTMGINHKYALEACDTMTFIPEKTRMSIDSLLYFMIAYSDNEATNMLADRVGIQNINNTCQEIGAKRTMIGHLLLPKAYRHTSGFNLSGSNVTTSNDMNHLLSLIYTYKIIDRQSCEKMIDFLEASLETYLGKRLPRGTLLGNKIGLITDSDSGGDLHDVGVINRDYVLSVMMNKIGIKPLRKSRKSGETHPPGWSWERYYAKNSKEVISHLSRIIYNCYYVNKMPPAKCKR